MKEQDLIDLGFEKVEVTAEESGDKEYYYYTYTLGSGDYQLSLITESNDIVIKDNWSIELLEYDSIVFHKIKELKMFIALIKRNMKE